MTALVEVTWDEDVYYNFEFNHYIRCPRTDLFQGFLNSLPKNLTK